MWYCQGKDDRVDHEWEREKFPFSIAQLSAKAREPSVSPGLRLQMRNDTHFEKSIGCHALFMGSCVSFIERTLIYTPASPSL